MRTDAGQQGQKGFSDRFCIAVFAAVFLVLNTWSWGRFLLRPAVDIFPLMWPFDRFQDLLNYRGKMLHLDGGAAVLGTGKPVFNYPAPAAFLFHWFLNTPDPPLYLAVVVLGAFIILLVAAALLLFRKGLLGWPGILGLAVLASSYPMMFVLYRANFEGIVWLLTTGSLCLLLRRRYLAASVLLGLAISIKPFPGLLLLLFLARRQYRAVLVSLGVAGAVVLAALAALGPSIAKAYQGLQPGVALYTHDYILTFRPSIEQEYSHGVIDVLRVLYLKYVWFAHRIPPQQFFLHSTPSIFPILYVGFIVCLATLMVVRLRSMPVANQVLGSGIALTLLPPSAGDYTLCSLYLPVMLIGFFLLTEVRSHRAIFGLQHLLLLVVPCAFLLSPMNVFGFWVSVWRFLLLLLLTWAATTLPMPMASLDAREPVRA